jgi:predicted RNase H-like HicB family nuclease
VTEYALYLESGPQHKKTMVHVPALLGCMANGPTTGAALEATPDAIRAYLSLLRRIGEDADPDALVTTKVAEHITEGMWLGNGSPYISFAPDLDPLGEEDIETYIRRFHAMREVLAAWADAQDDEQLDAKADGRTARAVLIHVLGTPGAYLSPITGAPGVSRVRTLCERGEMPLPEALRQVEAIMSPRLRETTPAQRAEVFERGQMTRTLRKQIRRTLEHDWEHLAELARRPGGPVL